MKKAYFLLLALSLFASAKSQTIVFSDGNFKAALLEASYTTAIAFNRLDNPILVDANQDGEIQVSETVEVHRLLLRFKGITDLSGIEFFSNLTVLECNNNNLTALDVSDLSKLYSVDCSFNRLTSLNVTGLQHLQVLDCEENLLTAIDFSGTDLLKVINCSFNELSSLNLEPLASLLVLNCQANHIRNIDISHISHAMAVYCGQNQLETLKLNNGFEDQVTFKGNATLQTICADAVEHADIRAKILAYEYDPNAISVTDCSLNVNRLESMPDFVLAPNPATNQINIRLQKENEILTAGIYNVLGQMVLSGFSFENGIDISALKPGNYFLRIHSDSGISNIRFVKK